MVRIEMAQHDYQIHRDKYERLRSDVTIKLKFLEENKVKVMHKQLLLFHNAISAYFAGNQQQLEQTLIQFNVKLKPPGSDKPSWLEEHVDINQSITQWTVHITAPCDKLHTKHSQQTTPVSQSSSCSGKGVEVTWACRSHAGSFDIQLVLPSLMSPFPLEDWELKAGKEGNSTGSLPVKSECIIPTEKILDTTAAPLSFNNKLFPKRCNQEVLPLRPRCWYHLHHHHHHHHHHHLLRHHRPLLHHHLPLAFLHP
ncbi:unnamed protein product [Pleuronectes platessa]|uniref:AH domain-containing protein n=1 Tax=Pleuronectes platessa TaxID=8262 RepID=A0A9N7U832_PLEPL|nr:unnamed protein product [Pleuronectes platessa]